jgi:hypothetical protein
MTDLHIGLVLASELSSLSIMTAISALVCSPATLCIVGFVDGERRGSEAAKYGSAAFGIKLLHALLIGSLSRSGGCFVRLDARYGGRVVDVP